MQQASDIKPIQGVMKVKLPVYRTCQCMTYTKIFTTNTLGWKIWKGPAITKTASIVESVFVKLKSMQCNR